MMIPAPPAIRHTATEVLRFPTEAGQLLLARRWLANAPIGDGHPVMTLPGFGGADGSMAVMRRWLQRWQYDARPWLLGRNLPTEHNLGSMEEAQAFRREMTEKVRQRVIAVNKETGRKVSLIGWSLGGIYANLLAQEEPDLIRQVITLGTPYGDPRGTAIYSLMSRMNGNHEKPEPEQQLEGWVDEVQAGARQVPTTVVYSKRDGIVNPAIARLQRDPKVDHVRIRSSHVGFTFNPRAYWVIANRLAQTEGKESPLRDRALRALVRVI